MLHNLGHAHPVSCVDCHDPKTMGLKVTRPGLIQALELLAEGTGEVKAIPSITRWREGNRKNPYDVNKDATHLEMRSMVCAQCHVEYYCSSDFKLTFPWAKGLKMENL